MKLSQKIFMISYLLMMISMYIMGYLMINNNYKESMDKETSFNISSHQVLREILFDSLKSKDVKEKTLQDSSIENIENLEEDKNTTVIDIITAFNKNYINNQYIQVKKNTTMVYNNLVDKKINLDNFASSEHITTYVTKLEDEVVLFVISNIQINDDIYEIVTGNNITSIYDNRQEEVAFFVKVSIVLCIVVSILLFIFVYAITRKINRLNKAVQDVSQGNYHIKVKEKGKDEIATLASGFNKMTQAINDNLEKVNQLSESRKEFVADMTHEIKTPLTSIIGYSELLNKVNIVDRDIIVEYADRIHSEGIYIKEITEKLMDIVLLDNHQIELKKIPISEAIKEACQTMQSVADKQVVIETHLQPDVYGKADRDLIKSLMINLMKNSMAACPADNAKIIVNLSKEKIQVIDNGKGISQSEMTKILEPFYTLDKSRNRERNGLGLGLYLCNKIIQLHHFKMEITSKENEGTMITIHFGEEKV